MSQAAAWHAGQRFFYEKAFCKKQRIFNMQGTTAQKTAENLGRFILALAKLRRGLLGR
jgi:hypothetical protein